MRLAVALASLAVLVASEASAFTVVDVKSSSVSVEAGLEVYSRVRSRKVGDADFETPFDLSRARLKLSFRYGTWLRADLEPDFGGDQADVADVFLQIAPIRELDFRIGQAKVPFGMLESEGRWKLPVQRRGMVNSIMTDRLGFTVRRLGARARVRLREVSLRPTVEVGIYGGNDQTFSDHAAGRLSVRVMKGSELALAGYTVDGAADGDGRGYVGAASFLVDRKRVFAGAEVQMGRARLLAATGLDPGGDATFIAIRGIGAYEFKLGRTLSLQPYVAIELFEPNLNTRDDLSYSGRAGLNLFWFDRLRLGVEADYQAGQTGAVVLDQIIITGFAGVRLE